MNRVSRTWRSRWLSALLLLGLAAGLVAAQTNPMAFDPAAAAGSQKIDPNDAQVDPASGLIKFIAFQKDMNIKDSLRLLAALCQKNIVPSAGVEGPLTISRLYNVTFEKALEAVLGNSFKYEQDGDFVRVYTADEYKKIKEDPARMISKVIPLYYTTAAEADKLIKPVLSASGRTQPTSPAQKSISGSSGSGGLTSSGGGADDMALNDMIVIFDYPENIEKAEAVIKEIDRKPRQVLVEATILAARLTEEMDFGIDWNLLSGVAVNGFPVNIVGGQGTYMETTGFANPAPPALRVGFSANNVQALITALEAVTDTTILANPKILAVNKQEGSLLIGRKIGYRGSTTISTGGVATQGEVQFLQTGTQLVFRPYIGDNGYIRMVIYPKDSTGELDRVTQVPNETTTEVMTNVIVKDGQTLVLGGLFRDAVTKTRTQVPVLGNLPFVGVLFRGTTDRVEREEVIIMLTPHIIDEPGETRAQERIDDIRRKREAAKDSLEVIDAAKIAEEFYAMAARHYLEGDTEKALFHLKIALLARPTYLEALRLRERIIAETDPEQFKRLDSITTQEVGRADEERWLRR